jgi:imidazolonepropionase-like amidohydrolase
MKMAYDMGVNIVAGTDCGVVEHGLNLLELKYLCEMGMEPMEAIQAATKKAAECLGWQDKVGTLEKGKMADIVVVKKDPVDDIASLSDKENILMVIKDGKIYKNIIN